MLLTNKYINCWFPVVIPSLLSTNIVPVPVPSVASTAYTSLTLGTLAAPSEGPSFPRIWVQSQRQQRTSAKPNILYVVEFEPGLTGHFIGPAKPIPSRSAWSSSRTDRSEERDEKNRKSRASKFKKSKTFILSSNTSITETDYSRQAINSYHLSKVSIQWSHEQTV